MENKNTGREADKQPAGRIQDLFRSGACERGSEHGQMERLRSLPNPLSLRLPNYPTAISCYCIAHSVAAALVCASVTGHLTFRAEASA